MIEKARALIYKRHSGQTRKGKKDPFTNHLEDVFEIARSLTENEIVLASAYLHDIVEDTDTTIEEIREMFGKEVADFVASETEDKRAELDPEKTWKIRKEEQLYHLKNNRNKDLYIIALSDKLANTNEMVKDYREMGDKLWERFNQKDPKEIAWYYNSMADIFRLELGDTKAFKELKNNIDFLFNK